MAETNISCCPEWTTTIQETDQETEQETGDVSIRRNRWQDMKQYTVRSFSARSRLHVLRLLLFFIGVGGLFGYVLTTSHDTSQDTSHDDNKDSDSVADADSQFKTKHRDKRETATCNVDMCLTKECVHVASDILQSIDNSVDPCEDFFQYTCGGWIKENEYRTNLLDDLLYGIQTNLLPEKIDLVLGQLLKQNLAAPEGVYNTKPYQNLFAFYESCMFEPFMSEEGNYSEAMELLGSLQEFQIGRPFNPDSWNLTKAILELMRINGAPLLDIVIQADVKKPGQYAIDITPPRRYGLIPALFGPRLRNPGVEMLRQNFRLKGRELFGDLSKDSFMSELLSSLEFGAQSRSTPDNKASNKASNKATHKEFDITGTAGGLDQIINPTFGRHVGSVGNLVGKPSLNVLPTDDFLEKPTTTTTEATTLLGTTSTTTKQAVATTMFTTTFATETSTTTAAKSTYTSTISPSTASTQVPTTTKETSLPDTTVPPSFQPSTTPSPYTTSSPSTSSEIPPIPTVLGPMDYESEEEIPEYDENDYPENVMKVVSRKAVFEMFKRNLDRKRTENIGSMVNHSLSNMEEASFGDFQPVDIYTAVVEHFVPMLDEIQPTEQQIMQANQHALVYNHFTLDQLQKLAPIIEWRYLLSELFQKNITDEEDHIYVNHPNYIRQLNLLLTALDPWVVHYGLIALYGYDVMREAVSAPPDMDRSDFCLQASKNVFGDVMTHMYLQHVGNDTIKNIRRHSELMIDTLRAEVRNSLMFATWLQPSDRQEALMKLNGLRSEVGGLDRHWDISYVNESHEGINLSREVSFLDNVMVIYRTFRKELYEVYQEPVDREMLIWSFTVQPYIVNAFHMQTTNTIVFPEAFFQTPYYSTKAPEYINYGSTGTSMAHEIFHGMDFTGTLFDHRGVLSRPFSNASRLHLRDTVDCYHHLLTDNFYEEVPIDETETRISMEIDSSATLNENLADIGGIRHAFRAYQRWEAQNYREPRLPAISLNPYQLFFVAAVRPYCAVIPDLAKIFLMEVDEHLPNDIRMNGMLMNTPEFAKVFNCRTGSRMVANQTCPIFP